MIQGTGFVGCPSCATHGYVRRVPFIEAGEKVTRRRATKKVTTGKTPSAEIRAWAVSNGIDVPARGRIP